MRRGNEFGMRRIAAAMIASAVLASPGGLQAADAPPEPTAGPPNIVLILADDMGWSDLGCYGGEIPTPTLDALAAGGLRFTQFYNSARCSPTRAALLTGLHPHQAGVGRLSGPPSADDPPGYVGYLNQRCVTLAEVLRTAGYRTFMSGKWHVGQTENTWPLQRGFDRFYGIAEGATSYLQPKHLLLDNRRLPPPSNVGTKPSDYYLTDAFTDHAIQTVREHSGPAPFFLYLAFTAPHWPLQAKEEDIARFVGTYRDGWDSLRAARYARQVAGGLVSKDWPLSDRDDGARAWQALTEQQRTDLDYRMAVYAAQVHRMDANIGRLIVTLREKGILDTTLVMFLSDNGGCAEPYTDLGGREMKDINDPAQTRSCSYGRGWANLSNTPFRRFKSMLEEGGIATPLIVHWPAGLKAAPGQLEPTPCYLTDIMPTFMEVGGARYPADRNGEPLHPLEGRSLVPLFAASRTAPAPRQLFWEQYGNRAVRDGDWKALRRATARSKWELYDLAHDRTELEDLAAAHPETVAKLAAAWEAWAARAQVFPAPGKQ